MKEIRRILYATDFSESSISACDYALSLARLSGARLHVLHVIGELVESQRSLVPPESFDLLEKEVEVNAVKEMERFCREKFDERVDYTTEMVVGVPFEIIIRKADEIDADLIVMGTHARTGIGHALLGSTAERVIRESRVAVLTVKAET